MLWIKGISRPKVEKEKKKKKNKNKGLNFVKFEYLKKYSLFTILSTILIF